MDHVEHIAPSQHAARLQGLKDAAWFVWLLVMTGQWILLHALQIHLEPPWEALLPGLGIFGAAFLLSWGAELAQLEMAQALALACLALVAVLPEYAVDLYLAWTAAKDPTYIAYAAANMTGANRILIGFGWPVILFCFWVKTRQREIRLEAEQRIELVTLVVATLYAFVIPWKRTLSLWDTAFLIGLFAVYLVRSSRAGHVKPEFEGPAGHIAILPRPWRRALTLALFLLPAYTIFIAAEPFADGLLHSARQFGVEEFLLIQWLAPLASESPEFIVAILFALHRKPGQSLGTLVSSKVNQWTLLIGMLPLAYAISGGSLAPMHLDERQAHEILLTAAQSLFAIVLLANQSFGLWEGVMLFSLFLVQLCFPWVRVGFSILYLVLTAGYLANKSYRTSLRELLLHGWRPGPEHPSEPT